MNLNRARHEGRITCAVSGRGGDGAVRIARYAATASLALARETEKKGASANFSIDPAGAGAAAPAAHRAGDSFLILSIPSPRAGVTPAPNVKIKMRASPC